MTSNRRKYVFTVVAFLLVAGACSSPNGTDVNGGFGRPNGTADCSTNPTGQGCPCSPAGSTVECGEIVRRSTDFVTCSMGHRTCTGGSWGICEGDKIALHSVGALDIGGIHTEGFPSGPCIDDPCNPACYTFDQDGGVDAGPNFTTNESGITLQPADGSACTGLACQIVSCDGGLKTTITGTVTDPAGARPINSAFVYVPNAPLQPFPPGVQNDPCGGGGTLSGSPIVVTQTAVDGTFTLQNVPAGANIPLVIQVGRWRRRVTIPNVPACATTNANTALGFTGNCAQPVTGGCAHSLCTSSTTLTANCDGAQNCVQKVCAHDSYCCNTAWDWDCVNEVSAYCQPLQCPACPAAPPANYGALHLPQDKTQGDIPQIALVTGGCDMFECLLKRIGVNTTEFTNNLGSGRVHMYQGLGGYPLEGGMNTMGTLFASQAQVNKYDMVLLPCDCGREYGAGSYGGVSAVTSKNELVSYANVGGRFFTSHWGRNWIELNSGGGVPFPNVANWTNGCGGGSITANIDTGFAKGLTFANWMNLPTVGAGNPFTVNPERKDVASVIAPTERWVYASTAGCGLPEVVNMAFNTPLGAMQKNGRVAFSDTHVSAQDGFVVNGSVQFPTICNPNNTMTAQEKALEYMFFDLGACNTPVNIPPFSNPVSFTIDYQGQCPNNQKVVWRFFDWKAIAPLDSSIDFFAATASTQGGLGAATSVGIGTASVALATASAMPPPPANWIGTDVSTKLPVKSQSWLRVKFTFNPSSNGQQAPTLSSWRQLFDCVDNL